MVAGPSSPQRAGVIASEDASKDSFRGALGWEGQGEVAKEVQNLSCLGAHTPAPSQPRLTSFSSHPQEGVNSKPIPGPSIVWVWPCPQLVGTTFAMNFPVSVGL